MRPHRWFSFFLGLAVMVSAGPSQAAFWGKKCARELRRRPPTFSPQFDDLEGRALMSFGSFGYGFGRFGSPSSSVTTRIEVLARIEDAQTGAIITDAHSVLRGGSVNVAGRTGPNGFTQLKSSVSSSYGGSVGLNLYIQAPGYFTVDATFSLSLNGGDSSKNLIVHLHPVEPFVEGVYQQVFQRSPSSTELQSALAESGGKSPSALARLILSTPDGVQATEALFASEGGKPPRQVVVDLYQKLLPQFRVTPAQLQHGVAVYRAGRGQLPLVLQILGSKEFVAFH